MPKSPEGYQPLLRRGSRGSLWLADDHLLYIENTGFFLTIRETYRRLDFSNIRAVLHAKSSRGAWFITLFLLVLAISITILALAGFDSRPAQVSAGLMALPALIGLSAHFIKGPTHSLTIQTTVRPWRIKAVTRHKHVLQVLAALEPFCLEAQKDVISTSTPGETSYSPLTSPIPTPSFPNTDAPMPVQGSHPLALPAWLCLLAFAIMIAGEMTWNSMPASLIMMGFATAFFVLIMIAFTRGGGTLSIGGRGVLIFALSMLGINLFAGYAATMTSMIQSSLRGSNDEIGEPDAMLRSLARFPEGSPDALTYVGMGLAALTAISAIAGLAATIQRNKLRRTSMQAPTPDSP